MEMVDMVGTIHTDKVNWKAQTGPTKIHPTPGMPKGWFVKINEVSPQNVVMSPTEVTEI